jgi:hypothetical protein
MESDDHQVSIAIVALFTKTRTHCQLDFARIKKEKVISLPIPKSPCNSGLYPLFFVVGFSKNGKQIKRIGEKAKLRSRIKKLRALLQNISAPSALSVYSIRMPEFNVRTPHGPTTIADHGRGRT